MAIIDARAKKETLVSVELDEPVEGAGASMGGGGDAAARSLEHVDPEIYAATEDERRRQSDAINLIASENYCSPAVREAQASVMTNKYAEGYPGKRWYNGCEHVDRAEQLAIDRAGELFGADHVNVQLHSGSGANMAAYYALMKDGDRLLAMDLAHGGHLTHGHRLNFSSRSFDVVAYGVDRETERIDYDAMRELAVEHKPNLIVMGASAYSRIIDFTRAREIADEVGACLMADIAHIAGVIIGGDHPDPVPVCDVVTSTTHKTLRGPRGALVLCRADYAKQIDRQVFPGLQGGPLMHTIAAKAVCFKEALQPDYRECQRQVVRNAKTMADVLAAKGLRIVSGGTDNHLMLVDLTPIDLTGDVAATTLEQAGITVNKNAIPFDTKPPAKASGIRLGTPALTTRGMGEDEMRLVADRIFDALRHVDDAQRLSSIRAEMLELASAFPVP